MANLADKVGAENSSEDSNLQDRDYLLGQDGRKRRVQRDGVAEYIGETRPPSDPFSTKDDDPTRGGSRNCWVILALCAIGLLGSLYLIRSRYPTLHFSVLLSKNDVSKLDDRMYQFGKLDSGLNYLVVQDTKASKVGMSVAVNAGGYDNPKNLPGLAHFLEHMVFLGSERYGPDSKWDEFMGQMDGYNNAYTADEETVYFAELSENGFEEGLERLGFGVQKPLLLRDKLKEVHAVDSEHTKNREVPVWRIDRILNLIADPDGFTGAFQTGNIDTLQNEPKKLDIDVQKALKDFQRTHYCAQNMVVVVFSNFSVEKMAANISSSFQAPHSDQCAPKPIRPPHQTLVGTFAHMYAENYPTPRITMQFAVPFPIDEDPAKAPQAFLKYILNYYGEDQSGLQGILYSRALVIESQWFAASSSFDSGISFQAVPMPGVNWKTIVSYLFAYVNKVIQATQLEMDMAKSVSAALEFKWQWSLVDGSPSQLASSWASDFSSLDDKSDASLKDFNRQSFRKIDLPFITKILSYIRPDNCNIVLSDQGPVEDGVKMEDLKVEPYYDIKYTTRKFSPFDDVHDLASHELKFPPGLPPPPVITKTVEEFRCANCKKGVTGAIGNAYGPIPEDLNLDGRMFYRYGSVFAVPNYSFSATIITRHLVNTTEQEAKLLVFFSALDMALEPLLKRYGSLLVSFGISYSIMDTLVITFKVGGVYSEEYSKKVINKVFDFVMKDDFVTDALMKRTLQEVSNQLTDYSQDGPLSSAYSIFRKARTQYASQREDIYKELPSDLADTVKWFREIFAGPVRIDYFTIGGIEKPQAQGLKTEVENKFKLNPKFIPSYPRNVRKDPINLIFANPQKANINSVGILLYERVTEDGTLIDWQSRAVIAIINQILGPFTFVQLRQNAPTPPYTVTGTIAISENSIQLVGSIQDHIMKPKDQIALLTKHFTDDFVKELKKLSDGEFETYKTSLKTSLSATPSSSVKEFAHFANAIYYDGRENCFQKELMMSHAVEDVKKSDLLPLFEKVLNSTRSTAEMYPGGEDISKIQSPEQKTLEEFKKQEKSGAVSWSPNPKGSMACHGRLLAFHAGETPAPN